MVWVLFKDLLPATQVFILVNLVFLTAGIIDAKDLLSGFSNEQIAVIFLILFLSSVIQRANLIDSLFYKYFNQKIGYKNFIARMGFSVAPVSAFVNNTPLVAILMPYVYNWAKQKNISPSKVLIPLSYATMLGGTITLVGTSTNLVVNSFYTDSGHESLKMFDFSMVGIPLAFTGLIFLIIAGWKLLPDRKDALTNFSEQTREFLVETIVKKDSKLINKTVQQAGLRNLQGLFLVEIVRKNAKLFPVSPKDIILENDKLIFAGETQTIIELIQADNGLSLPDKTYLPKQEKLDVVEVVISANSDLEGKKIKESNFRAKYDAAVVAINRKGEKLNGKIGEVVLKAGDLLLLLAGNNFKHNSEQAQDYYIISQIKQLHQLPLWKTSIILLGTLAAFISSALGYISLFHALIWLMAIIGMIKVIKFSDLKKSFDVDLFLILTLSLSIGKAIDKSNTADLIGNYFIHAFNTPLLLLIGAYVFTNVLSMLVTNKAGVAIMFPITMAAVKMSAISDPTPYVLAIAFAGSAEFITPYGYQTNLMVYGPGGYRFKDYVKIGWPLSLIYAIVCIAILSCYYNIF
jgi:di/tricarboxylate transporter